MPIIEVAPSEDEKIKFFEHYDPLFKHERVGFVESIATLGDLILSGKLTIAGTNLVADPGEAELWAARDDVQYSIIDKGVSVTKMDQPYEAEDCTDTEGVERPETRVERSFLIGKTVVADSKITDSTVIDSRVSGSVVTDSVVIDSEVTGSTVAGSHIDWAMVTAGSEINGSEINQDINKILGSGRVSTGRSSIRHSSVRNSSVSLSNWHRNIFITDSRIAYIDSIGTKFKDARVNDWPFGVLKKRNTLIGSTLTDTEAWLSNLEAVDAKGTTFGEEPVPGAEVKYAKPGGRLHHMNFLPGSKVINCDGGGSPDHQLEVGGTNEDLNFSFAVDNVHPSSGRTFARVITSPRKS